MPANLGSSGPYTAQNILNAVASGSGTTWVLLVQIGTGTAGVGTVNLAAGAAVVGTIVVAGSGAVPFAVHGGTAQGTLATAGLTPAILGVWDANSARYRPIAHAMLIGTAWSPDSPYATIPVLSGRAGSESTSGTWVERSFNNYEFTALAGTARAVDTNSADLVNHNAKGVAILVDITTGSASGTIGTVNVQAKIGTGYQTIYSFPTAAMTTGTYAFLVYPGAASTGGWTQAPLQGVVPRTYRIQTLHVSQTGTMTYSVVVSYIN